MPPCTRPRDSDHASIVVLALLLGQGLNVLAQYDWPPDTRGSGVFEDSAMRRSYRLEDFLWTGSGDGEVEPSPRPQGLATTTVYKTTTVLATPTPLYTTSLILITQVPMTPLGPIRPTATLPWPVDSDAPTTASPSWTLLNGGAQDPDEAYDDSLPDPRFWLVTVVKANGTQDWHLSPDILEARLARLYKAAFIRQQERHLGISNHSARLRRAPEPVRVTVHNVTGTGSGPARLLYWVRVGNRPVPAATAAHDMRLVSDIEMAAELGLPVITKAEPYLHAPVPLAARGRTRDAWLLVGAAGCGVALLVLLLALAAAALSQRSRAARRRRVTPPARHGRDNKGFLPDDHAAKREGGGKSSPSPGFLGVAAPRPRRTGSALSGSGSGSRSSFSCASSCSGSGSSSDAALVRRRAHPPHRGQPVHAVNQTLVDTLHLTDDEVVTGHPGGHHHSKQLPVHHQQQPHHHHHHHHHQTVAVATQATDSIDSAAPQRRSAVSPNSYLSMPSVKQFPRGVALPEPLTRVLEPVSVSHLDCEDSMERVTTSPMSPSAVPPPIIRPAPPRQAVTAPVRAPPNPMPPAPSASIPVRPEEVPRAPELPRGARHSSLEGDPGVLGPVVWGLRCQRLTSAGSAASEVTLSDGVASPPQVGRMRRRFHELLDDAFSLFAGSRSGSRSASQDEEDVSAWSPPGPVGLALPPPPQHAMGLDQHRVQSAVERPVGYLVGDVVPRPKTSVSTEMRRPSTASGNGSAGRARGAWGSDQTVARPLSAGPFHRPQLPDGVSTGSPGPPGDPSPRPSPPPPHPRVDTSRILVDTRLLPHDPAVPLIAAIKQELTRFGPGPGAGPVLPGSAPHKD